MIAFVEHIQRRGLWQVAVGYGVVALVVLAAVWAVVSVLEFSILYVRLTAVLAFMGFPIALGIGWALREPRDPEGKGYVVRD